MNNKKDIQKLDETFRNLCDRGEHTDAEKLLDKYVEDGGAEVNVAGAYIDLGSISGDKQMVLKGIKAYKNHKKHNPVLGDNNLQAIINYNIGNGYQGLFEQTRSKKGDNYQPFVDNKYLIKAMEAYQLALNLCYDIPELYVNYANLLNVQGRYLEAIEYYDKALKIDDKHGMAYGNKAICITKLAQISGQYQQAQYIYAYQLLEKAILNQESVLKVGGLVALTQFQEEKKRIKKSCDNQYDLYRETRCLPFDMSDLNKNLQEFFNFGREHDLFLHLHVQDQYCEATLIDHVFISIITPVRSEKVFYKFADWINEIKESYMTARYLLFESNRKTEDKTHISKLTAITNPLDSSIKTLYTGLKKTSVKEAFNILDKIACFLNQYIGMEVEEKAVSWDKIWFKDVNKGYAFGDCPDNLTDVFHKKLENLDNYTLFSLFSLYLDIEKTNLRNLRNALTHRKVSVKCEGVADLEDVLDIETLEEKAIQLLQFVKYAIIYLINFVNSEERQKAKDGVGWMPVSTQQFF